MNRHDMLVELASDQVNQIEHMIREDQYEDVHLWLHPILLNQLKLELGGFSDEDVKRHYCDQMGVDMPDDPPLSSADGQEKVSPEAFYPSPEGKFGSLSESSHLDNLAVSLIHSICNAPRMGEVAAKSPVPTTFEASLPWY